MRTEAEAAAGILPRRWSCVRLALFSVASVVSVCGQVTLQLAPISPRVNLVSGRSSGPPATVTTAPNSVTFAIGGASGTLSIQAPSAITGTLGGLRYDLNPPAPIGLSLTMNGLRTAEARFFDVGSCFVFGGPGFQNQNLNDSCTVPRIQFQTTDAGEPGVRIYTVVKVASGNSSLEYDVYFWWRTGSSTACPVPAQANGKTSARAADACLPIASVSPGVASNIADNGAPNEDPASESLAVVITGSALPLEAGPNRPIKACLGSLKADGSFSPETKIKFRVVGGDSTRLAVEFRGFKDLPDGPRDIVLADDSELAPPDSCSDLAKPLAVGRGLFYISRLATPDLEVNQGVEVRCAERPCVAEHNTVVRARMVYNDPKYSGLTGAVALLHVLDKEGKPIPNSPFSAEPLAPPLTVLARGVPAPAETQRLGYDTLNFRFLESLGNQFPEGAYDFYLTINPADPRSPPASGNASDPLNRAKNLVTPLKAQRFVMSAERVRIAILIDPDIYKERAVVGGRTTLIGPQIANHIVNHGFDVAKAVLPISASRFATRLRVAALSFAQLPDVPQDDTKDKNLTATFNGMIPFYQDLLDSTDANDQYTHVFLVTNSAFFNTPGASKCSSGYTVAYYCVGGQPFSIVSWKDLYGDTRLSSVAHELGHHYLLGDTYPGNGSKNNPITEECSKLNVNLFNGTDAAGCPVETKSFDTLVDNGPGTPLTRGTNSDKFPLYRVALIDPVVSSDDNSDYQRLTKRDMMGNSPRSIRWVDQRSWNWLYAKTMPPVAPKPERNAPAPQNLRHADQSRIFVSGLIGQDDSVTFNPARRTNAPLPPPSDPGDYSVGVVDSSGQVLVSSSIDVSFLAGHSNRPAEAGTFVTSLPFPAGAAKIVVSKANNAIGSLDVSPNPPTVQLISPNGGESLDGVVTLSWVGADPDGDPLTYALRLSVDDGVTWSPIAFGLTGASYDWDTSTSPGTTRGRLQIVANDGVNEAVATSVASFQIAFKGPVTTMTQPAAGSTLPESGPYLFAGYGFDFQDGALAAGTLSFSSNRDGLLGEGRSISVTRLSAGVHTITLTGTNSQGITGASSIEITVGPSTVNPPAPSIDVSPKSLEFGTVAPGQSKSLPLAMKNTGGAKLTVTGISGIAAPFSAAPASFTLDPEAQQTVTVVFAPTNATTSSNTLSFSTSDGANDSLRVPVTGTGGTAPAAPSLSVALTSLDFGLVTVGSSQSKALTITNNGNAVLDVMRLTTAAPFSVVSPAAPLSIAAGASSTVTVAFAPRSTGTQTDVLTITSNDAARPSTSVNLTGTGIAAGGGSAANLLCNGSFEQPGTTASFLTFARGSTQIPCWSVTFGDVDYIGSFWTPSHGSHSIDLDGNTPGAIAQTFATQAGRQYTAAFDMAGHPGGIKRLRVSAAGQSEEKSFDTTGRRYADMGWQQQTFRFTASGTSTTLEFASLSASGLFGPGLDNVCVAEGATPCSNANSSAGSGGNTGGGATSDVLRVDDGTHELATGFNQGGVQGFFVNRLTPASYPATLRRVLIQFPAGGPPLNGLPAGSAIQLVSSSTAATGQQISGLTPVRTNATVTAFDTFVEYDVPALTITSGHFLVGFTVLNPVGVFPMAVDHGPPLAQRSYIGDNGSDYFFYDSLPNIRPGNFMIRARVEYGGSGGGAANAAPLRVTPSSLSFTSAEAGTTKSVRADNTNSQTVTITRVTSSDPSFVNVTPLPAPTGPGSFNFVQIRYSPAGSGTQTSVITVETDPPSAGVQFVVTGTDTGGFGGGVSTRVATVTAAGWPNGRTADNVPANAIDGNTATFTWTTAAFASAIPSYLGVGFSGPVTVRRIRLFKDADSGGAGLVGKNLIIEYTTSPTTTPLASRVWTPVTGLVNGFQGAELLFASGVGANGTVTNDTHNSLNSGFAQLTFNAVEATGVRIGFSNVTSLQQNHYRVYEFEVYR